MNKFEHVGGGGGFLYSEVPCLGVEEGGGTGGVPYGASWVTVKWDHSLWTDLIVGYDIYYARTTKSPVLI